MKNIFTICIILLVAKLYAQCPPQLSYSITTQTLTCNNPTILAVGNSTSLNTQISWIVPSNPSLVAQTSVIIGPPNGPATSTVSLSYSDYTVVATNTLLSCQATSVITINQNFKPPISSPTVSIGTPTAVYCTASLSPVVLTVGSSTTTSGGGPLAFIITQLWEGPVPQATATGVSSYSCYVPGNYSLTVKDNYNGCTKTSVINVIDKSQLPIIVNPVQTVSVNCGLGTAHLYIATINPNGYRYLFDQYPAGAAFGPANATATNFNPLLSGTSNASISVSGYLGVCFTGVYHYIVTNTLTGCQSEGVYNFVLDDPIGAIVATPAHPTCSVCCDGTIGLTPPVGFTDYSVSVTSGTLNGSPVTSISNLCYGKVVYCITRLTSYSLTVFGPAYCQRCDSLVMDGTTNIQNIDFNNEFVLYPNPTNSAFFIKNNQQINGAIKLYNYEGKEIQNLILQANKEIIIDNLNAGIYFIEIKNSDAIFRKKIVVIK